VVAANPVAVYTAWGCEPLASLCAPPSPDAKCCVDFAGSRGGQDLKMSGYFQQHFFDGQVGASPLQIGQVINEYTTDNYAPSPLAQQFIATHLLP
jgi:hypothetical protein